MKKLQEDKYVGIMVIRHKRGKRILIEQIRKLKDFVQSLKVVKRQSTKKQNKHKLLVYRVYIPMMGYKYARNM
jgi:hypothetical protein